MLVGTTTGLQIDQLPEMEFLHDLTQPTGHPRPATVKPLHLRLGGVMCLQPEGLLNSLEEA